MPKHQEAGARLLAAAQETLAPKLSLSRLSLRPSYSEETSSPRDQDRASLPKKPVLGLCRL